MARKPFSLTAYMAMARGRDRLFEKPQDWPPRTPDPVLWLHSDTAMRLATLLTLVQRLRMQRDDFTLLLTSDAADDGAFEIEERTVLAPPAETLRDIQRFLQHWQPDVLLWAGNGLRPALLNETSDMETRMLLVDAADAAWRQPKSNWLPDATAGALGLFHQIVAQDKKAAQRMRRLGVSDAQIDIAGPLEAEIFPLPSQDVLHDEMISTLAGRPVWLAACIHLNEADAVLRAHRRAARLAHRLLLVIVPRHPEDEPTIAELAQEADLRLARWDHGEMADENTQVLLAGDDSELGVWYRVAPLCFLGGSLHAGTGGQSPMMAAALGSAILYGPNVGQHLDAYSRLVAAGGARIVKDMDTLSSAVTHLIAPDRAAAMAHAGWNVVSSGAETADLVLSQVNDWLDAVEARP